MLTQKPYRYQRKNATKKVRQKPHTIIIHYSLAVLAPPFVFPCVGVTLVTDEVLLNLCRQAKTILKNGRPMAAPAFQWRIQSVPIHFFVAQPVDAGKTVTSGTDESVPYERPIAAAES